MKRSTLVAFGVLIVLIGVVYWLEQGDGAKSDVETVFDVEPDAIDRVEIRRFGEEPVIIERVDHGNEFRLVAPVAAAGDSREVDLVLSNLGSLAQRRSFTPDVRTELAEFGLDTPRLEVRFTTVEGDEHGIRFGKDTLTESNQYAERLEATDVLVVASHVSSNLDKNAWDLRDKAIFHIADGSEPTRVSITHKEKTLVLVHDAGVWMTLSPPRARVDPFAVTGMVSRFRQAEMLDLAEESATTGLDRPEYRLDVMFQGNVEPLTLEIGTLRNIDFYARVPSRAAAFVIEGGLVAELQKDPQDWWSKKLLHHPTSEATEVRIVADANDEQALSQSEAQDLLRALAGATADEVVTTTPSGDPVFVVRVTTDNLQDEISIRLENNIAYARRKDEDVALRLPPETWTELASLLAEATAN